MSADQALLSVAYGHAIITLNRPERLNALTREMLIALRARIEEACANPEVRVVTLTGAGRGFCAGQDLSERDPRVLKGPLDLAAIQRELFHPVVRALAETRKPVITRLNGIAAGAGAALALAADIVIAGESAKLALSFAKVGLSVDAGLGRTLAAAVGPARAKALLMLGETLTAGEAAALGLIWKSVPDADLDAAHADIAARLLATPVESLGGIKTAIAATQLDLESYLAVEAREQGRAGAHPDYAEGVLAFLERRPARFS